MKRRSGDITALDQHVLGVSAKHWGSVPAHLIAKLEHQRANRGAEAKRLWRNAAYDAEVRRRQDQMTRNIEADYLQGELERLRGLPRLIHYNRALARIGQLRNQLGQ